MPAVTTKKENQAAKHLSRRGEGGEAVDNYKLTVNSFEPNVKHLGTLSGPFAAYSEASLALL